MSQIKTLSFWFFLFLVALGSGACFGIAISFLNPSWREPFFGLLSQSWSEFKAAEGSSSIGVISGTSSPVVILLVTALVVWRFRGVDAMKEHIRDDVFLGMRAAVIASLILYGPVWIWGLVKTIQEDRVKVAELSRGCWMSNLGMKPPSHAPAGVISGNTVIFWCASGFDAPLSIRWDFTKQPSSVGVPEFPDTIAVYSQFYNYGTYAVAFVERPSLDKFQPTAIDLFSVDQLAPQVNKITITLAPKGNKPTSIIIKASDLRE